MPLRFVPLEGRARWAIVFLVATVLVNVLAIAANIRQINAINDFVDGKSKTTTVIAVWWALWIIGSIVGNVATRFFFGTDTLPHIRHTDELHIAALLLDIVAAAFAIVVVGRITHRLAGTTAPPPVLVEAPAGAALPPMP